MNILPLPAVHAATINILPMKCLNSAELRILCPSKITHYTVGVSNNSSMYVNPVPFI